MSLFTLPQERFLLHSSEQDEQGAWWVPVTYALQKQYQFINQTPNAPVKAWLPPEDSLTIDLDDNEQWLLVNTDRRGRDIEGLKEQTLSKHA